LAEHKSDILHKSRSLFQQFGYKKTTLTDIAKSVGKVKTAIYYYFSGKEEIFAQLVKVEATEFLEALRSEVGKHESAKDKLECYIVHRLELMQKVAKRYHFLKKEFFELMPLVEENRATLLNEEIIWIESILLKGTQNNEFNVENVAFASKMLVQSIKGLEIQMYVTDQILLDEIDLKDFTNLILYGVVQKKLIETI